MTLVAGTRLGPYEIVAPLGAGGMGEVYRATDTNLKRSVAIKVLPASVAGDPDRLSRFRREAEVLAALNHPNIAHIYGIERDALVMELVEGEDLSAVITRGPIPTAEALSIARQIADALETAHEQGIVHRDLKPQNIKVRADGTVKVLDFGLAKALEPGAGTREPGAGDTLAHSPTFTSPAVTAMGVILGTAAYMSPEQAKGRAVDKRADIWAFGVVLYEMLTGRPLFGGDSIAETIGFVATRDPDWATLPTSTPASVRRLLRRCLTRDPRHRLRDIGEARIALTDPAEEDAATTGRPEARARLATPLTTGLAIAVVVTATLAGYLAFRPAPAPSPIRLDISSESHTGLSVASFRNAVSPDGKVVAFEGRLNQQTGIWLRPLASGSAYPLAGTEGGMAPFWSPDGSELGFLTTGARRQIKKVPVGGGQAQTLGELPLAIQGTWNQDGVILLSQAGGGGGEDVLFRLPASGGTPTRANAVKGSRWPSFLRDGRRYLYTVVSSDPASAGIFVGSLDSPETTRLTGIMSSAQAGGGYLFYVKDQTLMAHAFDEAALRLTGDPVPVFENVFITPLIWRGGFSVSDTTLIAQAMDRPGLRQLTWMNRSGVVIDKLGDAGDLGAPDLSPDGKLVTFIRGATPGGAGALWMLDLERNVFTDLRREASSVRFSSSGARIAYSSRDGVRASPVGGGDETVLLSASLPQSDNRVFAASVVDWSPDDTQVLIQDRSILSVIDAAAHSQPQPIGQHFDVALSPAGGWMAYRGGPIFVEPFTGKPSTGAGRMQVSPGGGDTPRWRSDGKELYYISNGDELMATPVTLGPVLKLGTPVRLFAVPRGATYDVSADGQRFLLALPVSQPVRPPLSVMLNWRALLPQ